MLPEVGFCVWGSFSRTQDHQQWEGKSLFLDMSIPPVEGQPAARSEAQISGSEAAEGSQDMGDAGLEPWTPIENLSISSANPHRASGPVLGIEDTKMTKVHSDP